MQTHSKMMSNWSQNGTWNQQKYVKCVKSPILFRHRFWDTFLDAFLAIFDRKLLPEEEPREGQRTGLRSLFPCLGPSWPQNPPMSLPNRIWIDCWWIVENLLVDFGTILIPIRTICCRVLASDFPQAPTRDRSDNIHRFVRYLPHTTDILAKKLWGNHSLWRQIDPSASRIKSRNSNTGCALAHESILPTACSTFCDNTCAHRLTKASNMFIFILSGAIVLNSVHVFGSSFKNSWQHKCSNVSGRLHLRHTPSDNILHNLAMFFMDFPGRSHDSHESLSISRCVLRWAGTITMTRSC